MYHFSENIQRGIIYLAKTNLNFYLQISPLVKPEYFETKSQQLIYQVIQTYHSKYHKLPIDEFILEDIKVIKAQSDLLSDFSDELEFINKLDTRTVENLDYYVTLVEQFAKRQALKEAIVSSVTHLKEGNFGAIEEEIKKAMLVNRNVDLGQNYFRDYDKRWARQIENKKTDKFPCILSSINDKTEGGFNRKELVFVVAPPGGGKSLFLVNQTVAALRDGKNVLYVTLEMSEDKIARRFDSVLTGAHTKALNKADIAFRVGNKLKEIKEKYNSTLIIKEFPTGQANINTIRALLSQLKMYEDFTPDILIVDYLELLRPIRIIDAEYMAQQRIAEELRGLGVEHNILVFTATQSNRNARNVEIITDLELGDSYGKIRTADFAISLNQSTEEYDKGEMRAFIIKARDSEQKYTVPMSVNYTNLRMSERVDKEEIIQGL